MESYIYSVVIFLAFVGCKSGQDPVQPNVKTNSEVYQEAIRDAMVAEENEISSTLIAIKPDNSYLTWSNGYVLVVTWTKYSSSYPVGDTISTSWGETWVTVVPEMKDWYKKNPTSQENITLRTEQLLGMPENSKNIYFVEMWVKPENLFRPAYDNEINDNVCGLTFTSTASSDYIAWFNGNIITSYYPSKSTVKYPWTRLGYTFDWGNPYNEVGLSEFIISKSARVIVKSKSLTQEYLF